MTHAGTPDGERDAEIEHYMAFAASAGIDGEEKRREFAETVVDLKSTPSGYSLGNANR